MNKIEQIKEIVKKEMEGLDPSHDFSHVMRVYNLCMEIAKYEKNVDLEVLKIAALLHDIARKYEFEDKTGKIDHAILGAKIAGEILEKLGYNKEFIKKVQHCIETHRFRKSKKPETIEAKILYDADKIDVLGAIGVARTFISVGVHNQKIFPEIPLEEYKKINLTENGRIIDVTKHSPYFEYELKLKHLYKTLYTKRGKELAKERAEFMDLFFERLKKEFKGEI